MTGARWVFVWIVPNSIFKTKSLIRFEFLFLITWFDLNEPPSIYRCLDVRSLTMQYSVLQHNAKILMKWRIFLFFVFLKLPKVKIQKNPLATHAHPRTLILQQQQLLITTTCTEQFRVKVWTKKKTEKYVPQWFNIQICHSIKLNFYALICGNLIFKEHNKAKTERGICKKKQTKQIQWRFCLNFVFIFLNFWFSHCFQAVCLFSSSSKPCFSNLFCLSYANLTRKKEKNNKKIIQNTHKNPFEFESNEFDEFCVQSV